MFCIHCGSQVPEGGNFCVGCGSPVKGPPAAFSHPSPVAPAPHLSTPPAAAPPSASAKCSWCGNIVDATEASCPRCGAAISLAGVVAESGWAQLPARKDMAKLQFGNSFCQVEGLYVPVADMNLAAEDGIYFTHHVLLWKDPQIDVTTMPLAGGWKRLFAGMPLIMTQAQGPGHIAFSRDLPGELIALPLQPGQAIDVREHLFLVATAHVQYDWFQTGIWFRTQSGNETETHYPVGMFMDRFTAPAAPGLLLLHAGGNVFVRHLGPGQTILIKPTSLIFKDPTVQMALHFERPSTGFSGWGFWGNRYLWLRLSGPGRVAVQSVFEPIEGEARNITNFSYATEQRW
jgi:uncharacterized protein (AIM24 family)